MLGRKPSAAGWLRPSASADAVCRRRPHAKKKLRSWAALPFGGATAGVRSNTFRLPSGGVRVYGPYSGSDSGSMLQIKASRISAGPARSDPAFLLARWQANHLSGAAPFLPEPDTCHQDLQRFFGIAITYPPVRARSRISWRRAGRGRDHVTASEATWVATCMAGSRENAAHPAATSTLGWTEKTSSIRVTARTRKTGC
jgi:hypothetical protein